MRSSCRSFRGIRRSTICDLALRLPYRQAAAVASRLTGEPLSHLSCWRILLTEGARVRAEDEELVASVFELGAAPPEDVPSPDLVVVEADGTFVRAQREAGDRFEVNTGTGGCGGHVAGRTHSSRDSPDGSVTGGRRDGG